MHERYENKLNGTRVEGSANYSNFREFKVNVDEDIAPIDDKGKAGSLTWPHVRRGRVI